MNSYEAKQADRKACYEQKADQARKDAETARNKVAKIASTIPPGQPVLVGHHSEARHRRDLERIDNGIRASIELEEKADYYEQKASGVGRAGISSDDPDAIEKLKSKLATLEQEREDIKTHNKNARKNNEPTMPAWKLQNLGANIRHVKARIAKLEAHSELKTRDDTIGDVRIIENAEANRLQIFFPGKPTEDIRSTLKSSGFRWAPSLGCWQAYLNNRARYCVQQLFKTH